MPARMKDIANDLGLSVVTISKVLRNHADISEETRERVLKRMKELNYRPNLAARALVTGRTHTIGLLVPDLVYPFFGELAKGLARGLRTQDYGLFIASSEEDPQIERQEIEQMLSRRVDAIVVASAQESAESFHRLEERKTPYVLVDRKLPGLPVSFVGIDDTAAGALATEHLIQAGCRRIAHIRGPEVSTSLGRFEGYRAALRQHNLEMPDRYVQTEGTGDEEGELHGCQAMQKLLALDPPPDGVFCYNDPTAMGALRAIFAAGLRVPDDIAVIGFGNFLYSDLLQVPLSSIDQRSIELGMKAAELALMLIASKKPQPARTVLLEPRVVARASTQRRR
ncbi:MAG TPA: LacI family DNA-binding transcriptional regulator [Bryobacteraceae bacterium]|nr:LacI family DNA-binding transcriptional regulator [Bryobacteraceae bacterium]